MSRKRVYPLSLKQAAGSLKVPNLFEGQLKVLNLVGADADQSCSFSLSVGKISGRGGVPTRVCNDSRSSSRPRRRDLQASRHAITATVPSQTPAMPSITHSTGERGAEAIMSPGASNKQAP